MSGLSQRSHRRVGYIDGVPFDIETTLPGEFRRAGYQTQGIGKMHVYPERARIGFDDVILHDGYLHFARRRSRAYDEIDDYLPWLRDRAGQPAAADYVDDGLNCNSVVARPWGKPEALHPTTWVVTQAIQWLFRRDPTVPFLLYLSFFSPHPPYNPPSWALDQYLNAPPYEPVVGDWWEDFAPYRDDFRLGTVVGCLDPHTLHRARAGYYGNIAHVDLQINRFLEALGEFGLAESTYVGFTSDHGELLGEHHLFRKGLPYEGSARIPFVLSGPADSGIVPGTVSGAVAELRDVMPTLLDCAGLPSPNGLDGRSLLPFARGSQPERWRRYLHGEHTWLGQSFQWVTDGKEKYCWRSGDGCEQLFDLTVDPHETHDLATDPGYSDRREHWRRVLVTELRDRPEGYVDGQDLITGRPPACLLSG